MRQPYVKPTLHYGLETLMDSDDVGFLHPDTRQGLQQVLETPSVLRVVEIGSFHGKSARMMGEILKARGGHLWCVDPWVPYDQLAGDEKEWNSVYNQFLSNMIHAGIQEYVTPIRMPSVEGASSFDTNTLDMVYIDGMHSHDAVKADILAWWPKLKSGGVMCGDDYGWKGIADGISEACHMTGAKLIDVPTTCGARSRPHFWQLHAKD